MVIEWEGIHRTMLVEGCVVDTDVTDVCIFLWDNDWVGYPARCFYFLDEPSIFQAMKFGCYCFVLWVIESSKRLLDSLCVRIHI
jgi:hypothetical protein